MPKEKRGNNEICFYYNGIIGVNDLDEAGSVNKLLMLEGIGCIKLGEAFKIAVTPNKFSIGYVSHLAKQDDIYDKVFGQH